MYISSAISSVSTNNVVLKPGQIVRGKVLRHLDNGKILAQVQSSSLVAETDIQVSVGDLLIMYVKKLGPKPHLQVMRRSEKKNSRAGTTQNSGKLLDIFLKNSLPISKELMVALTSGDNSISQSDREMILSSLGKNPDFWRRLLWHSQISSQQELLVAAQWEQSVSALAQSNLWANGSGEELLLHSGGEVPNRSRVIQIFYDLMAGSKTSGVTQNRTLQRHVHHWEAFQQLPWENNAWAGILAPALFADTRGALVGGLWRGDSASNAGQPTQLSLFGLLEKGGIFYAKFEYRTSDFAGVVEVSNPELYRLLDNNQQFFRGQMNSSGYQHLAFQMNFTPELELDCSKLMPGMPANQTFKV